MDEIKYVIFRLEDQKYGMNLQHISGIEQGYQIIPVPNSPKGIKGIINLRGDVIPVYDLRAQFGMASDRRMQGKSLLVSRNSGIMLAYEVDEVITIAEIDGENQNAMPNIAICEENTYFDNVLHLGNEIVIAVNVFKILSEEMKAQVGQFIKDNNPKGDSQQGRV